MAPIRLTFTLALLVACMPASACSAEDIFGDGGTGTTGGPDASMCPDYCRNVMTCNAGWGGGMRQYASRNECEFDCRSFVEEGGACGMAAESYFACAASIDDCAEYGMEHEVMCADLEDGFAGWCL
ncbi:MAG: hypothetical protein D6705_03890 [Deltaproteobacteria bacterium]|nr:MAG: hypothetical protein D6705_03890 [Deltaproteobacteria bacterium]